MNAINENFESIYTTKLFDQENDKVEDAFLAFFDNVGGLEMSQCLSNINNSHFKINMEESDEYTSEENHDETDEENLEGNSTRMDVDFEEESYNTDYKAIEVLIDERKKDFHHNCAIMILNPITLKTEACNKPSTRRLWNLIGNWEINSKCLDG
ncbi:hypothetical protein C2G38_2040254 [Gigaspora rosea]|uniref:Uncharacterized protein n=1 Tax=Gigaspora rosea TaxID=44941 RepID=A0A397UVU9_9GLOM|nr:hypothetical protein C2G38_2040254 [Gigaspora rosea]